MRYRMISFTTDYGLDDEFVAVCHGVIAGIAPDARVLDVTHTVPPLRIRSAAAVLCRAVPYLPESVHLAVVDPGVGTARRGIVLETSRGLLVGPDNGLLPPVADVLGGTRAAYELAEPRFRLPGVSATFHGRDVFAPAAAHLALGVPPAEFGPAVTDPVRLPEPMLEVGAGRLVAEVLGVDRFGNVLLAANARDLEAAELPSRLSVHCGSVELSARRGRTFADAPPGEALVLLDSLDMVAIAINGGSAADALAIAAEGHLACAERHEGHLQNTERPKGGLQPLLCTITGSPTAR